MTTIDYLSLLLGHTMHNCMSHPNLGQKTLADDRHFYFEG